MVSIWPNKFIAALLSVESGLIILLHPLLYYVFFSTAARIWNGAGTITVAGSYKMEKLNGKVPGASLVTRERRRTLTSAVIDGVWGVWMLWMCRAPRRAAGAKNLTRDLGMAAVSSWGS